MAVSPPFDISIATPAASDNINLFPSQNSPQMDTIESWLLTLSDNMGVIKSTALPDPLEAVSTAASASSGPVVGAYRDSPSPAAADLLGRFVIYGNDSADNKTEYADMIAILDDPTNGSEDATLRLRIAVAGALLGRLDITTAGASLTGALTTSGGATIGGNTSVTGTFSCSGALASGSQTVTGSITASGSITTSSDMRLKENIQPLYRALDYVNRLKGVSYTVAATGVPNIGLIAQDVREVLPEVVVEDENGYLSIAYGNIVAVLVEAVKELSAKVAKLEAAK